MTEQKLNHIVGEVSAMVANMANGKKYDDISTHLKRQISSLTDEEAAIIANVLYRIQRNFVRR